jgi:hypothetical protein
VKNFGPAVLRSLPHSRFPVVLKPAGAVEPVKLFPSDESTIVSTVRVQWITTPVQVQLPVFPPDPVHPPSAFKVTTELWLLSHFHSHFPATTLHPDPVVGRDLLLDRVDSSPPDADRMAFGQAGSTGGTLGKTDKSARCIANSKTTLKPVGFILGSASQMRGAITA